MHRVCHVTASPWSQLIGPRLEPDPKVKGLGNSLVQGLCLVRVNTGHTNHMLSFGSLETYGDSESIYQD